MNWLHRAKVEASKPIPIGEKIFGIGIVLFSCLMIIILHKHLADDTSFITRELNWPELFLLFGYWIDWIITASLDSILSKRLASRLFDSFGGIVFLALCSLYFLVSFPFDFKYFAVAFPEQLRFLVGWINDGTAKVILGVGGILMIIATIYSPIAYGVIEVKKRRNVIA